MLSKEGQNLWTSRCQSKSLLVVLSDLSYFFERHLSFSCPYFAVSSECPQMAEQFSWHRSLSQLAGYDLERLHLLNVLVELVVVG